MKNEQIFDGIRGLAFVVVLLVHGVAICYEGAMPFLQGCGKYGVWLFFVLSSFLLTKNYLLSEENKLNYIVGRILRIVPLYFLACVIYIALDLAPFSEGDWLNLVTVRYGPIHLWTIPAEFYFYIFLLLLWFIKKQGVRDTVFLVSTLSALITHAFVDKNPSSTNTLWYLPSFFIGYMLARIWGRIPHFRYGTVIAFSIMLVFVMVAPGTLYLFFNVKPTPYLMNMYFPLSLLWGGFMIAVCKSPTGLIYTILTSPIFCFFGHVSYSGYLFHLFIMIKVVGWLGYGIISVALSIVLSILCAYASFVLIERPLNHFRRIIVKTRMQ